MYVSDYLSYITTSEIKQLAISDIGGSTPTAQQKENKASLITFINLANSELHKKFSLISKEMVFTDVKPNSLHAIPTDFLYAISASYKDGTEIPINDESTNYTDDIDYNVSILFPTPFEMLVKGTDTETPPRDDISLVYMAAPGKVTKTTDFIDLPETYTEALITYVAYKAHAAVSGDMKTENNTYYLRYRESTKNIKLTGLANSDNLDSNTKLTDRGFV
jgi:hypothetical protein